MSPPNASLTRLLAEVGWKPEHFAYRLNQFAGYQGITERVHGKTPYKWQNGDTPRSPWPILTAALLSERLQRIIHPHDLGWPDDGTSLLSAASGLTLPWNATGGLQATRLVSDAGDMDRRLFLTVLGTTLTSPALEWLIAHPADDIARTNGNAVPIDVVDHLDAITDHLRRIDDQLGGARAFSLVKAHLATVLELLENRRYADTVGRRLHTAAAELLRLGGWLSFDAGRHARAQRWWISGLHEAHTAGDRALGSNILGFMSCQAKDIGQLHEAITLAEAARTGYPGGSARVNAILELRAAEAYANNNDAKNCRLAIDNAFSQLASIEPDADGPSWAYWLNEAQVEAQAGYCYVKLEEWDLARTHLRAALHLQGGDYTREGALRNALLATTYIRQQSPDLNEAAALAAKAVDTLTDQVSSSRCVRHVRRLAETMQPYKRNSDIRNFLSSSTELLRSVH